jgi:hypothetical protein
MNPIYSREHTPGYQIKSGGYTHLEGKSLHEVATERNALRSALQSVVSAASTSDDAMCEAHALRQSLTRAAALLETLAKRAP